MSCESNAPNLLGQTCLFPYPKLTAWKKARLQTVHILTLFGGF